MKVFKILTAILLLTLFHSAADGQKMKRIAKVKLRHAVDPRIAWSSPSEVIVLSPKIKSRHENMIRSYSYPKLRLESECAFDVPVKGGFISHTLACEKGFLVFYNVEDDHVEHQTIYVMYVDVENIRYHDWHELVTHDGFNNKTHSPRGGYQTDIISLAMADREEYTGVNYYHDKDSNILHLLAKNADGSCSLVRFNCETKRIEKEKFTLRKNLMRFDVNQFVYRNGEYIIGASEVLPMQFASKDETIYFLNAKTKELKHISLYTSLPLLHSFHTSPKYIYTANGNLLVLGLTGETIEGNPGPSELYRTSIDLKNKEIVLTQIDPLPTEYFVSSTTNIGKKMILEDIIQRPDGSLHLICYARYSGYGTSTSSNTSSNGVTYTSTHTFELKFSENLILLTLDTGYRLINKVNIPRSVSSRRPANLRVQYVEYGGQPAVIFMDIKKYYTGKHKRKNSFIPIKYAESYQIKSLMQIDQKGKPRFVSMPGGKMNNDYNVPISSNQFISIQYRLFKNVLGSFSLIE